ncbi:MAG: ABC transporter ATP-binding protein [Phycisphaerales bacterium]|jgi:ABC-2 type transport system ATP-binding protein|nr:ABC transporter ATP-binding protein [Phycisphaerales bacterium]MDP7087210.1 ABC transporter ATP-binding protein [Phycisphaerales bacterium]MDP7520399.1 ABC transporter ATP-binding protein [Phycisphaerales bacterium]MDP7573626.1 ABC transporter ATP-binding protein [Phycisphaerales bacterium]
MIRAHHLTKRFGTLTAVDDISFEIERGRIAGFLGPNGAGKTTTMRMLSGVLQPSEGRATIGGVDVAVDPRAAHAMLGWLPEAAPACDELRVLEYLRFRAGLFGGDARRRIQKVLGDCGLIEVSRRLVGHLSRGYRQRVALAAAIVHDPAVLILDEPGTGLDPVQQRVFRGLLRELAEDRAILFSTHQLGEAAEVCDDLLVIGNGRLLASNSVQSLRGDGDTLIVEVRDIDAAAVLARVDGVQAIDLLPSQPPWTRLRCEVDGDPREAIFKAVSHAGGALRTLSGESRSLDQWVRSVLAKEST